MTATHYEALGVPKDADGATIRRAYQRKAARAHPDRAGGSHQAMVPLTQAYETLCDPDKRARYDQTGRSGPAPATLDQMAEQLVMSLMIQVIEQMPEDANHVEALQGAVRQIASQAAGNITKLRASAQTIERRRKNLAFRGKGRDFLLQLLEQRLRQIPEQITASERQIEIAKLAAALCTQYEWKVEEAPVVYRTWTSAGNR